MRTLFLLLASMLLALPAAAAERRPVAEIQIDAFTKDTQVTPGGSGDRHVALVWWIPVEFWQAVMARDPGTNERSKKALLDAMQGVSLLAVVQADVSDLGAFDYYPDEVIAKNLKVSVTDAAGKTRALSRVQQINPNLEVALGVFKPILSAAMGNLGRNFNFYVLDDRAGAGRILDPYQKARITVELARNDKTAMTGIIETPLNSLFVPRHCPGGEPAHISWKFCPWNGERLPE